MALLFAGLLFPIQSKAQWGIGASYEIRQKVPENGFGVRIERDILQQLPIVSLGLRAHFSYFNDENQFDYQDPGGSFTYSSNITDYDYGVTALGGASIGFVKPYVGVGLGSNTINVERSNLPTGSPLDAESNSNKIYWNALIGAEISAIPALRPFVEYRHTDVGSDFFDDAENLKSAGGRIVFGVLLKL